jgi:regulator of sirC expression with transglutaminase-like and TPR domain
MNRGLLALCAMILCGVAYGNTRTWTFHLRDAGAYKVQIEHRANGVEPSGTRVTYAIRVGKESQTRDLDLFTDHPFIPLVLSLPSSAKMEVTISGLTDASLRKTRVYVYEANSQFPGEYFDPSKSVELGDVKQLRTMLRQPEASIDLGKIKVTVDHMVDPSVDPEATLQRIEAIVARIQAIPGYGPTSEAKLIALKRYVYEAGPWNEGQAYSYDLDDPLGKMLSNKLLATYLATKKGNCVTMPFTFIILGQRLGLDVTASTAPKHFLVKYRSPEYGWINLEATSGANPARDVWIRKQEPMTDVAVAKGVYLQPLTRVQTAAEMATIVAESYLSQQKYEQAIAIANVILEHYPKDVGTMTLKAVSYGRLARQRIESHYASPAQIPPDQLAYYQYLSENNRKWFAEAEAMGWREESAQDQTQYLERINHAKQRQASAPAVN